MLHDNECMKTEGVWTGKIYRADGTLREEFIAENLVPLEGREDMLNILFNGNAQRNYYCGLKSDAGIPADNWTYADINSLFTEFEGYDETLRQTWATDPASGSKVVNPTTMNFTTTANGSTVTGAMLVTNATKGDSAAPDEALVSILNFGSAKNLDQGEILSLSYSMELTSS